MVTFCTVNAGDYCGQGVSYTNILYDMVKRNLSDKIKGEFHVFTDQKEGYTDGIIVRDLPGNLDGWWNKLYLFKEGLFEGQVVFMDLDTLIVSGIDTLAAYKGDFAILRDFWRPEGLGSGVMAWKANIPDIYNKFERLGFPQDNPGGDQAFIETCGLKPDILQDMFPKQFVSYKTSARAGIPKDAKVVCFHGLPRPHQVTDMWVPHIWKIGGGSTLEFQFVVNVSEDQIENHIEHALTLPHENLDDRYMIEPEGHLALCGGGPSLADNLDELRWRQQQGHIIWALNNTFKYLIDNGIFPHAQIIMDAREENADFIPDSTKATLLLASQCHPKTFERAEASGGKIIIWHRYIDKIEQLLGDRRVGIIGCGTTVGMNALGVAQFFGLKHIHLYGYDSSYRDDQNHAYKQPLNDTEKVMDITVNGMKFKCAPWMAAQVEEFKERVGMFIADGMEFTIHGDGLLPYVASLLEQAKDL